MNSQKNCLLIVMFLALAAASPGGSESRMLNPSLASSCPNTGVDYFMFECVDATSGTKVCQDGTIVNKLGTEAILAGTEEFSCRTQNGICPVRLFFVLICLDGGIEPSPPPQK